MALTDEDTSALERDPSIVRGLVRLRYVLEHALAQARDSSDVGAHAAIVALDGAVEHSLWLVTRASGAQVKPTASRHDLTKAVRRVLAESNRRWLPVGAPAVDQLHRARNDAQHAAVQFNPAQLPEWRAATEAFIDGLITAAFDLSLRDVSLADAVRDGVLADLLRRAESECDMPDSGAFLLIATAFDMARQRWRSQQAHIHGGLRSDVLFQAANPAFGMLDGTISQDERLADFLEVAPFAVDLGEYLWFVAARRQQNESGWTPEPADTRRALVFVSGWIVRWEIFDRGYPLDRWNAHLEALRPPVTDGGASTEILGAEAMMTSELPGNPARCHLYLQLANVPDQVRGPWGNWLPQGVTDAAAELGIALRFQRVALELTGRLLLICDLGQSADDIVSVARRAIEITDDRFREWEAGLAARRAELARLQATFSAVINAAQTDHALFGPVEVTERPSDGQPIVWVSLHFSENRAEELSLCTAGFQGAGGVLASAGSDRERIGFEPFELSEDNARLLCEVIRRCEQTVFHRRQHERTRRLEFQRFTTRLGELLPGWPAATTGSVEQ